MDFSCLLVCLLAYLARVPKVKRLARAARQAPDDRALPSGDAHSDLPFQAHDQECAASRPTVPDEAIPRPEKTERARKLCASLDSSASCAASSVARARSEVVGPQGLEKAVACEMQAEHLVVAGLPRTRYRVAESLCMLVVPLEEENLPVAPATARVGLQ